MFSFRMGFEAAYDLVSRFLSTAFKVRTEGLTAHRWAVDNPPTIMSRKVYIGNLIFDADRLDLLDLFQDYGPEEVFLGKDKFTGRPKGFAFVTLESEAMAQKAAEELNGTDFAGREIKVAVAEERER